MIKKKTILHFEVNNRFFNPVQCSAFNCNIVSVSEIEKVQSKIFYLYLNAIRVFVRETANGRFPKPIKMKIKQIVIGENL